MQHKTDSIISLIQQVTGNYNKQVKAEITKQYVWLMVMTQKVQYAVQLFPQNQTRAQDIIKNNMFYRSVA